MRCGRWSSRQRAVALRDELTESSGFLERTRCRLRVSPPTSGSMKSDATCHKKEKQGEQVKIWQKSKHSKAYAMLAEPKAKDPERPLSQQGLAQIETSARAIAKLGLRFDVIVASTKKLRSSSARTLTSPPA